MKYLLHFCLCFFTVYTHAQEKNNLYPEPEFINEIYYLQRDSMKLTRLEKNITSLEAKSKLGGFGGVEYGYFLEGARAIPRINNGEGLSFIFYTGETGTSDNKSKDSILRANGIDPSSISQYNMQDLSKNISLYKAVSEKDQRKVLLQQGGMITAKKENNRYSFSLKKIKEGYFELVIDKPLPKGEYVFIMMNMDGSYMGYAFGIDKK